MSAASLMETRMHMYMHGMYDSPLRWLSPCGVSEKSWLRGAPRRMAIAKAISKRRPHLAQRSARPDQRPWPRQPLGRGPIRWLGHRVLKALALSPREGPGQRRGVGRPARNRRVDGATLFAAARMLSYRFAGSPARRAWGAGASIG